MRLSIVYVIFIACALAAISPQGRRTPAQAVTGPAGKSSDGPQARLVSVQVTAKEGGADDIGRGVVFNRPSGVHLTFFVLTEQKVLEVDWDACRMHRFVDEKGTDLSKTWGPFKVRWLVPNDSDDPKRPFTFTIQSKLLPAEGSRVLTLDAEVALLMGSELRSEEHADVTLAADSNLTLANVPCSISRIQRRAWDNQDEVTFKTSRPLNIIEHLECYDAAGNAIPTKASGYPGQLVMENGEYVRAWVVPRAADVRRIKLQFYSKTKVVPVRILREVGAGL